MDDVFSILKRENLVGFLAHINRIDEEISFTTEEEENGRLPFLDVAVKRTSAGRLRTSVVRKKTHTDSVLDFNFNYADCAKAAVVHALMDEWRCTL